MSDLSTVTPPTVPVFQESLAGSLIDSARISVLAAMYLLPEPEKPLIVLPGTPEENDELAAESVQGCLEQAMQWLDEARVHSANALTAKGAPPTSLHFVQPGGG